MKSIFKLAMWLIGALTLATSCQSNLMPDNVSDQTSQTDLAELRSLSGDLKGLILLDELLFNISHPMAPEEYITITNVSDQTIDVAGLSIGITTDFTTARRYYKYQNFEYVYASQVYTFPSGRGNTKIKPGESLKVARWAEDFRNRRGRYDNRDARFEVFIQPNDGSPSVTEDTGKPDMDYFSHFQAWHTQLDGSAGIFLIQYNRDGSASESNIKEYISRRVEYGLPHPKAPNEPRLNLSGVKIPAKWIIDAFQARPKTGAPQVHNLFPTTVVPNNAYFVMPLKYDEFNDAKLCKGIKVKRIGSGVNLKNTQSPKDDFKAVY
ncbi:hypothetical protein [uncultured Porphyromonas sp.]|uniref:hypothetical protein n=1 Tax=uncultured Porphyromonas sp. TaxID=159274 RepID=UPI0026212396|nr:hypothetical protein [uncultured Porphyromonas sp.]